MTLGLKVELTLLKGVVLDITKAEAYTIRQLIYSVMTRAIYSEPTTPSFKRA